MLCYVCVYGRAKALVIKLKMPIIGVGRDGDDGNDEYGDWKKGLWKWFQFDE